jgi:hypothetical protein
MGKTEAPIFSLQITKIAAIQPPIGQAGGAIGIGIGMDIFELIDHHHAGVFGHDAVRSEVLEIEQSN